MKYLIVRCDELHDQYECDANRIPEAITDDWEKYCDDNPQNYYDVWEIREDNSLCLVHEYTDTPRECGMAYVIAKNDSEAPTVVKKYPNRTQKDEIPKEVYEAINQLDDVTNDLAYEGFYSGIDSDSNYHCYCHYEGSRYYMW